MTGVLVTTQLMLMLSRGEVDETCTPARAEDAYTDVLGQGFRGREPPRVPTTRATQGGGQPGSDVGAPMSADEGECELAAQHLSKPRPSTMGSVKRQYAEQAGVQPAPIGQRLTLTIASSLRCARALHVLAP